MAKFAKGNNSKITFLKVSPINPLIIFYQLTKFEALSYNSFLRYLDYKFSFQPFIRGLNPQREMHNSTKGDNSD